MPEPTTSPVTYTPPPNSTNAPASCVGAGCLCCGRCSTCGQQTYNGKCLTVSYPVVTTASGSWGTSA